MMRPDLLWGAARQSNADSGSPPGRLKNRTEREADQAPLPVSSLRRGAVHPFPHTASRRAKKHGIFT